MAGSNTVWKGGRPNRLCSATQAETAPGTVTESQPVADIDRRLAKRASVQPAGARPEALSPMSEPPEATMATASLPMPLLTGSTTVSATAVAIAASIALPPLASMASPAGAASGWLVATQLAARIG
jgi:hypothetical protein